MVTSEERLKILRMIDEGKISAEDGAKLLAALGESRKTARKPQVTTRTGARWLRVRVTDMVTGKAKATVNLPMGLVDAGLKIASQYAPDVNLNFEELIQAINEGAEGKIVDVLDEEDGEHVEIFIE